MSDVPTAQVIASKNFKAFSEAEQHWMHHDPRPFVYCWYKPTPQTIPVRYEPLHRFLEVQT